MRICERTIEMRLENRAIFTIFTHHSDDFLARTEVSPRRDAVVDIDIFAFCEQQP